jgi:signal transduction histidine kinase
MRLNVLLLLTICLSLGFLFETLAQSKVDSLQNVLTRANSNNYRVILNELKKNLLRDPISPDQLKALEKNIAISQKLTFPNALTLAKYQLAEAYSIKKDYLKAFSMAFEGLELAQLNKLEYETALCSAFLGYLYNLQGELVKGLKYSLSAIHIFEKLGLNQMAARSYLDIAVANYTAENWDKSNLYTEKAIKIGIDSLPPRNQINAWNTLGLIAQKKGNFRASIPKFEEAMRLSQKFKDTIWIGLIAGNLGEVYGELGEYAKAYLNLEIDIEYSIKYGAFTNAVNSARVKGDFYLRQNQYEYASMEYNRCLALMKGRNLDSPPILLKIYKSLAQMYQLSNNQTEANKYLNLALSTQEIVYKQKRDIEISRIQASVEFDLKEKELNLLRQQNSAQQILIDNRNLQRNYLLGGMLFLLAIALFLYRTNLQKQKNNLLLAQQNEAILEQNKKIENQNREIALQYEELQQTQEELINQRDFIEQKKLELERLNQRLYNNDQVLRKAYQKMKEKEKVIQNQNQLLREYSTNLENEVQARTLELTEKNRELINYSNQLEQFAYITAHNVRAPVARMLGLTTIFDREAPDNPLNMMYLDKMQLVAAELDTIIKDLNVILEIKKGIAEFKEEVNLAEKVKKIGILLESSIEECEATIATDFTAVDTLQSVGIYWESILYNLISNAVKYRNPAKKLLINIATQLIENEMLLTIRDNGLGIDLSKYNEKLFGLYKRFHTHVEGKGLGLHLVKLQVEALGGVIRVESKLNEGTVFFIQIPLNFVELNSELINSEDLNNK